MNDSTSNPERDRILARLRSVHHNPRPPILEKPSPTPEAPLPPDTDLADLFRQRFEATTGIAHQASSPDAAIELVLNLLEPYQSDGVVLSNSPILEDLGPAGPSGAKRRENPARDQGSRARCRHRPDRGASGPVLQRHACPDQRTPGRSSGLPITAGSCGPGAQECDSLHHRSGVRGPGPGQSAPQHGLPDRTQQNRGYSTDHGLRGSRTGHGARDTSGLRLTQTQKELTMQFAVMSDSHGELDNVRRLAERLIEAGIGTAVHLGDDFADADRTHGSRDRGHPGARGLQRALPGPDRAQPPPDRDRRTQGPADPRRQRP